jgi:hypothetical protein
MATVSESGQFHFAAFPIGRYTLKAEAAGFAPFTIEMFLYP